MKRSFKRYYCNCQKYCGGQQREVSRATYVRHAVFRRKLSFGFKRYLDSRGAGPSQSSRMPDPDLEVVRNEDVFHQVDPLLNLHAVRILLLYGNLLNV
jgi:hypothetical protein